MSNVVQEKQLEIVELSDESMEAVSGGTNKSLPWQFIFNIYIGIDTINNFGGVITLGGDASNFSISSNFGDDDDD